MPAIKYDYNNYNQYGKSRKGVAESARSYQSSSGAQRKAASGTRRQTTPDSTRSSTRVATRAVATAKAPTKTAAKTTTKKRVNADIDIPVIVKKKVNVPKPAEMKLAKPKALANSKSKAKSKAKVEGVKRKILLGMATVFVLFTICIRYTQINEKFNLVSSLEDELASTEALNQQLSSNVESKTDLNYIEKYAKYQLGMQKPTESQIVRIAYEKQDKISTPVVIEEENEDSFWERLFNDLENLID